MHAVAETPGFQRSAAKAGMSADEIEALIDYLAENPEAGDEIKGTGGCRKLRVAGRGKGKSGGYRAITFYSGPAIRCFCFTPFRKAISRT